MKLLVVGRSGVGKSTFADYLTEKYGFVQVESYAARPMRVENEKGHRFITPEEAKSFTDRVAETVINGYEYFATRQQVEESDIYIIDPNGLTELVKRMPNTKFCVIYLQANAEKRKDAAISRADDPEEETKVFEKRIKDEDAQFTEFEKYLSDRTVKDNSFSTLSADLEIRCFENAMNNTAELYTFADEIAKYYRTVV